MTFPKLPDKDKFGLKQKVDFRIGLLIYSFTVSVSLIILVCLNPTNLSFVGISISLPACLAILVLTVGAAAAILLLD